MRARMAASLVGVGLVVIPVAAVEAWFRHQEAALGLVFPADQPGRKYALDGTRVGTGNALNVEGFNDEAFTVERTAGTTRVVLLGDSVTFGSGITKEQTYAWVAEEQLAHEGLKVEINNLAVYGYDVEQVAATLHYVGWQYQPDLVVYAWFTNDGFPSELLRVGDEQVFVGTSVSDDLVIGSPSFTLWACQHSAIARLWVGARLARKEEERRAAMRRRTRDDRYFTWWLDAMAADAKAHHTPFVVYGVGPHVLADPDLTTCGQPARDGRYCAAELAAIHEAHAQAFARGIPFISAVPWLQSGGQKSWYREGNPDDTIHPSAEGHVQLARGLTDTVRRWAAGEDLLTPPAPAPDAPKPDVPDDRARRRSRGREVPGDPG